MCANHRETLQTKSKLMDTKHQVCTRCRLGELPSLTAQRPQKYVKPSDSSSTALLAVPSHLGGGPGVAVCSRHTALLFAAAHGQSP